MSATVVLRMRARPGCEEAVIAATARLFAEHSGPAAARRRAALFQGLEDPRAFLRVADWDSRAAFEAYHSGPESAALLAELEGAAEVGFYRPLAAFEAMFRPAPAVACEVIEAAGLEAGELGAFLVTYGQHMHATWPSIVWYRLLGDGDAPGRFVVLHGWGSADELGRFNADAGEAIGARLGQHGATWSRFSGVARLAFERDR